MSTPWWEVVEEEGLKLTPVYSRTENVNVAPRGYLEYWFAGRVRSETYGGAWVAANEFALGFTPQEAVTNLIAGRTLYKQVVPDDGSEPHYYRNWDMPDRSFYEKEARKRERMRKAKDKPKAHGGRKGVTRKRAVAGRPPR